VERGAKLAGDVRVGPFSYIGPRVRIGPGCVIENNVTVTGRTRLGQENRVFPMAVIGVSEAGPDGRAQCIIGQANTFREHVTVYAGGEGPTRIGNDNLVMIGCQIGPGASVGGHGIFDNYTQIGRESRIEDYVRTSAFVSVDPGVTVGAYTFATAYAGIDRDAPPFAIVQGFPFRVRGANPQNLRRCGFGDDDICALKAAFRELFDGSQSRPDEEALRRLASDRTANPHVRLLVEAVRRSAAGRARDD